MSKSVTLAVNLSYSSSYLVLHKRQQNISLGRIKFSTLLKVHPVVNNIHDWFSAVCRLLQVLVSPPEKTLFTLQFCCSKWNSRILHPFILFMWQNGSSTLKAGPFLSYNSQQKLSDTLHLLTDLHKIIRHFSYDWALTFHFKCNPSHLQIGVQSRQFYNKWRSLFGALSTRSYCGNYVTNLRNFKAPVKAFEVIAGCLAKGYSQTCCMRTSFSVG